MLTKIVGELLKNREFISVATCDYNGRPNAAPKFILKVENNFVFLVDYIVNKTWQNLNVNPKASLSFMDADTLVGYQVNGPVHIIDKGAEYDQVLNELRLKEIDLSAKRIIEGITKGKIHKSFEVASPEKFVIFKVKMEEVVEIGPGGDLKRESL